jgi:hypothetical protein
MQDRNRYVHSSWVVNGLDGMALSQSKRRVAEDSYHPVSLDSLLAALDVLLQCLGQLQRWSLRNNLRSADTVDMTAGRVTVPAGDPKVMFDGPDDW